MKLGFYNLDQIYTGDARELAKSIPDQSVDLIFTDPPYLREFIPLYGWVAREAARVLKLGGFACVYAGTYWKFEVMKQLDTGLDYFFDMILLNGGNSPYMWQRHVISRHKSILVYMRKGENSIPRSNVLSFWTGGGEDKRYHIWGQDESSARYYIDCFSKPGDVVFDPFTGGGITCAVCKILDRRFLGFEIDPESAEIARARVENTLPPLFVPELQQIKLLE